MATPPQPLTQTVTQIVVPPPLTLAEDMLQTPKMTISELLHASDVCISFCFFHLYFHIFLFTSFGYFCFFLLFV